MRPGEVLVLPEYAGLAMLSFSRLGAARIPSLHGLPDRHIIKTEGPVLPGTRALRCPGSARRVM